MQRLILTLTITLMTCLSIAGCAKKATFVLLPDPSGKVGSITVTNAQGTRTLSQAGQFVVIKSQTDGPGEIGTMDQAKIHTLFGQALAIQPLSPVRFLLFFKPEAIHPNPESEAEIPKIMQAIEDRNSKNISVNGHTDRMGEDDYNYSLSFQRAKRIRSMLEKQGIDPSYITTTSHGPKTPLVPAADNVPEPLNRRVEVIVR